MSFNYISPKAETREDSLHHRGTFARTVIKKDETIAIFGGYIIAENAFNHLPDDAKSWALPLDEHFVIGPREIDQSGDGDFINHSCAPNGGLKGQLYLVAMRDIQAGEEITFDYAMVIYGDDEIYLEDCICGNVNCRKIIKGNDWQNETLQKKYKGYFTYFLQEKIDTQ